MNARDLFQQGATVSEAAAETGCSHSTAAYVCRPMAPKCPTLSPDLIARLPEHLQRQIKASNPNHRKATP
jgi:hypothetical protein